jgi:dTDP-4-dehydrorhamnose 3,5-epimerase
MPFTFKKLDIPEVILIETKAFSDNRGFFMESYQESSFIKNGINDKFIQDNYSYSTKGILRGLHYQKNPKAQSKLVTALKGKIFDVAVDIRKNSSTFGKWVGEILSEENHRLLYVPQGFAHGFCVISDEANVLYKVNNDYSPENDRGIIWNDSDIAVNWPLENPILSNKDLQQPLFKDADINFE